MTEPSTIRYTGGSTWIDLDPVKTKAHVITTYKNAVDTFVQLCKFHNLDPLTDIMSHSECYKKGIGTNHGDVEHIWNKFGLSMDRFRRDVYDKMHESYLVRVSIDCLNMRIGPSVRYTRIGCIPKGVYTIVETNGDWGRLKSKQRFNGKDVDVWIHLGHTTRL